MKKLYLRKVKPSDCRQMFLWVNEPRVRRNSLNTKKIAFDEHLRWFQKKINSPKTKIFILETGIKRKPVGQVRFDKIADNSYEVDISVSADCRNKGVGSLGLKRSCDYMQRRLKAKELIAKIKSSNKGSIKCFKKSGFSFSKKTGALVVLRRGIIL